MKFAKGLKVLFLSLAAVLFLGLLAGDYAKIVLPLLFVVVSLGFIAWKLPQERLQRIFGFSFVKQIFLGLVVTLIFLGLLWLIYGYAASQIVNLLSVEYRTAYLIVTLLGLPLVVAFWYIYQNAGIPGSPQTIAKGVKILMIVGVLFLGFWFFKQPYRMFNSKTGEAIFWVDDSTGKIYYHSGFSPETGEKLRKGTKKDLEKIKRGFRISLLNSYFTTQRKKQVFKLQAGEERRTVFVSRGYIYRIRSNKDFYAFASGGRKYLMKAGEASWIGDYPEGLLRVRGIDNDTIIIFQRVK